MQLIGAHMSIAGGVDKAIDRGEELGCTAIQIFVKQARKLFDRPIKDETVKLWHEKVEKSKVVRAIIAHTGYLINLASPDDEMWEKYIQAMADEMNRCDRLGIENIVMHPGTPKGKSEDWGIKRIAQAVDIIYDKYGPSVNIALETTAGQGQSLGWRFEHIRDIIAQSKHSEKLRVVFDTCHVFAAGYDFTTREKYEKMWEEFDKIIGLKLLVGIHVNDSKHPLGSRKDRHEHIGRGLIGIEPFKFLMQDERFEELPKVLETPKENDWDIKNLKLLWELSGQQPPVKL